MYSMYRNLPTFNKSATKIALMEMLVSLSPSNKVDLVSATTTKIYSVIPIGWLLFEKHF